MFRLFTYFLILISSATSFGGGILQNSITPYSSWKTKSDLFKKDCVVDTMKFSTATANNSTLINLRQLHIPTTLAFKSSLDSGTKSKLETIDKAAKMKALEILKNSKKYPLEVAQKSSGLGLTTEANLVPEDFLKRYDYKGSCNCLYDTEKVASNEAEYNKLTAEEFMIREEHHKVKCFIQSANLQ